MQEQFRQLEKAFQTAAAQNNLDTLLDHLIAISSLLSSNRNTTSRVFGSTELDHFCAKIGQLSLSQITPENISEFNAAKKTDCLFLATNMDLQDGCSQIIEELVRAQPDKSCSVLLTNLSQQIVSAELSQHFEKLSVEILAAPAQLSHYNRLQWIQSQLLAISPKTLFLFNQAHDAVAVSAAAAGNAETVFFHHHDHGFTLGTYLSSALPSALHVDLRKAGFSNCSLNLGIAPNMLPLTKSESDRSEVRSGFLTSGKLVTASCGSDMKFDQPYLYSLAEVIPRLIQSTHGKHIHIGELSPHYLERIKKNLLAEKIGSQHFLHLPQCEKLSIALNKHQVDIFIDSFPLGSCLALIEAMSIGMPIVTHHNYQSRLYSNIDLMYEGAPIWSEPADLYHLLSNLTGDKLEQLGRDSLRHYESNCTNQVLKDALKNLFKKTSEKAQSTALKYYRLNDLQTFFDQSSPMKTDQKKNEGLLYTALSQLNGATDIIFGNAVRLVAMYFYKSPEYVEFSAMWKCEQQAEPASTVAVHILNKNGEIIAQADHQLNKALLNSGKTFCHRFTLKCKQLIGATEIGIAVFDDPQNLLPIQGGQCDWDNRRLLLPLGEVNAN